MIYYSSHITLFQSVYSHSFHSWICHDIYLYLLTRSHVVRFVIERFYKVRFQSNSQVREAVRWPPYRTIKSPSLKSLAAKTPQPTWSLIFASTRFSSPLEDSQSFWYLARNSRSGVMERPLRTLLGKFYSNLNISSSIYSLPHEIKGWKYMESKFSTCLAISHVMYPYWIENSLTFISSVVKTLMVFTFLYWIFGINPKSFA